MDSTVITLLGVLAVVCAITITAIVKDKLTGAQLVPVLTLILGLGGGGAAGAIVADNASSDAANEAVAKVSPDVRAVRDNVQTIQRDVTVIKEGQK